MSFEEYEGIIMYPPTQNFKPYYDTSGSSESASLQDEEDSTLLEKETATLKSAPRKSIRSCLGALNASIISCIISLLTASLVILLLLMLAQGHPMKFLRESSLSSVRPEVTLSPFVSQPIRGNERPDLTQMHCGTTPAEARALGCIFDVMSFAWTPPSCYSHSLSQKFLKEQGPWIFYLDHNATQPLDFNTLSDYDIVWTEHHYHVVHCLYAWERIHRAYLGQDMLLPREMGSINHTTHCLGLLEDVEGAPRRKVNAIAYLVFDGCIDQN